MRERQLDQKRKQQAKLERKAEAGQMDSTFGFGANGATLGKNAGMLRLRWRVGSGCPISSWILAFLKGGREGGLADWHCLPSKHKLHGTWVPAQKSMGRGCPFSHLFGIPR